MLIYFLEIEDFFFGFGHLVAKLCRAEPEFLNL
jgi:hypothetical protein